MPSSNTWSRGCRSVMTMALLDFRFFPSLAAFLLAAGTLSGCGGCDMELSGQTCTLYGLSDRCCGATQEYFKCVEGMSICNDYARLLSSVESFCDNGTVAQVKKDHDSSTEKNCLR
eukprot:TRINITY_DN55679_c0_g1_i1.p1 TRINITY_DN55679_c0_g1~~TRINITY_DN55679_c0_g1_i1.p1  ORF type:complete len:116 (+),score=10.93 TRINITY_DN55679_c0_g1_i1:71-418(+)